MILLLEYKKIKRTGFLPAFFTGALLASAIPALNTAVRPELFIHRAESSVHILLTENWQMMSMLNVLLVITGACILYHTEYADNALQKMQSLPIRENTVFTGKFSLLLFTCIQVFAIEAAATALCGLHWFQAGCTVPSELLKSFGYSFFLILPCTLLSLFTASACRNMWTALGIGVVCVFTATMIPPGNKILSLFPFALPFQTFSGTDAAQIQYFLCASAAELIITGLIILIFTTLRRKLA